jgi:hypothetical protein
MPTFYGFVKNDEAVKSLILTTKNTKGQKIFNNFSFVFFVSFVVKNNVFYEAIQIDGSKPYLEAWTDAANLRRGLRPHLPAMGLHGPAVPDIAQPITGQVPHHGSGLAVAQGDIAAHIHRQALPGRLTPAVA